MGNINYAIYKLGNQGQAANGLRDVLQGNNNWNGVNGFTATPAYDQVSGWGTPDMTVLASALKSVGPPPSGVIKLTPPRGNFAKVLVSASSKTKSFKVAFAPRTNGSPGVSSIDIVPVGATPAGQFHIDPAKTTCSNVSPLPCTIGIVFTPTAKGTMNATLVVTDHATNSPQKATLTGVGK